MRLLFKILFLLAIFFIFYMVGYQLVNVVAERAIVIGAGL